MHMTYADAFQKAVTSNWGKQCESSEDAQRELLTDPAKILIGFFGALSQALGAASYFRPSKKIGIAESADGTYPDCKIGDMLWGGDLSDGFSQNVIIKMDAENHVYVVAADPNYEPHGFWAAQNLFKTLAGAVLDSAKSDVDYHAPRLNWAKQAIAAVEGGGDLQPFTDGFPDD